MKKEILKCLFDIKENLKLIEDAGISHSSLDEIYEDVEQIEDIIYTDDVNSSFGLDYDDSFE